MTSSHDYVAIVSGLPRSGTSMMMQMLHRGGLPALTDHIRTADEDNPKGYYEFDPVKKTKEDPSWLQRAPGKVVKIVHLLLLDLPDNYNYRVVFMRRELNEVVKSQNVMLERHQHGTGNIPAEKIKEIFKAQIDQVYAYVRSRRNFSLLEMNYNDMLADPEPAVARLMDFFDGRLDSAAMTKVIDPSLYRSRNK